MKSNERREGGEILKPGGREANLERSLEAQGRGVRLGMDRWWMLTDGDGVFNKQKEKKNKLESEDLCMRN